MQDASSPDTQAELARQRNHIAADRSLLSFVRTGLTLISLGVGINDMVDALTSQVNGAINPNRLAYILSLIFVGYGTASLLLAARDYQQELQRLQAPDYAYTPRPSLGARTGWTVLITGAIALVWIGCKALLWNLSH